MEASGFICGLYCVGAFSIPIRWQPAQVVNLLAQPEIGLAAALIPKELLLNSTVFK